MATCTRGPWFFSTCGPINGTGGVEIHVTRPRDIKGRKVYQRGQLDGVQAANRDAAWTMGLLYGYLQPYSRNTCGFVMSRAARRRGVKTTDWRYLSAQARPHG